MDENLKLYVSGLGIDPVVLEQILDALGPMLKRIIIALLSRGQVFRDCPECPEASCALYAAQATALCLEDAHHECFHKLLEAIHCCAHCCQE